MKISLEDFEGLSYFRCPDDGKALLWSQNGKIIVQSCDHYRWFLLQGFPGSPFVQGDVVMDLEPASLDDSEDAVWQWHIGAVAIGDKRLYLVRYMKTEKPS
jgi:hypothetical protein